MPFLASSYAIARPIPLEAPVIRAIFPVIFISKNLMFCVTLVAGDFFAARYLQPFVEREVVECEVIAVSVSTLQS